MRAKFCQMYVLLHTRYMKFEGTSKVNTSECFGCMENSSILGKKFLFFLSKTDSLSSLKDTDVRSAAVPCSPQTLKFNADSMFEHF